MEAIIELACGPCEDPHGDTRSEVAQAISGVVMGFLASHLHSAHRARAETKAGLGPSTLSQATHQYLYVCMCVFL